MLDDKYDPISVVPILLYTHVKFDEQGQPMYNFITNRTLIDGVEIPAKSPEGMFELVIPNDLNIVFKAIDNYYGEK